MTWFCVLLLTPLDILVFVFAPQEVHSDNSLEYSDATIYGRDSLLLVSKYGNSFISWRTILVQFMCWNEHSKSDKSSKFQKGAVFGVF